jgi:hypothetical protein
MTSSTSSGGPGDVYAESVIADGPILYLRFEEPDRIDGMINSAPGATVTGTHGDGHPEPGGGILGGGALEVPSGGHATIDFPELHFGSYDSFSVEMWARFEQAPSGSAFFYLGTWNGSAGWANFGIFEPGGSYGEFKRNSETYAAVSPGGSIVDDFDTYHHVVGVYVGSEAPYIYIDGKGPYSGMDTALLVGGQFHLEGSNTDGVVRYDEVAVYASELDLASIIARCEMVLPDCAP